MSLDEVPEHLQEMVNAAAPNLEPAQFARLCEVVVSCADIFVGPDGKLGHTDLVKHEIDTGNAPPVKSAPRRMADMQRKVADEEIEKMLQGVIEPSDSPWASPVVLVKKKDGSTRFCVDYRQLNEVTRKDAYPLPNISETLDTLGGAQFFSTLDLTSGYWQVEMEENDKKKMAFVTRRGLYHFNVMPFGLTNAPATFERLMELVLRGLQWERCLVYLDDIIIFGHSFEEALDNMKLVLSRLKQAGLKLKPKKCQLFQKQVQFLGHLVTPEGVRCDPAKVSAVTDWPQPTTVKGVRSFLGFASYYRRFIRCFSEVAAPLTALTHKGKAFLWTDACETAFQTLKTLLTESPILAYPSMKEGDKFILDTDASDVGLGTVLSQVQGGEEKVIAYASKTLSRSQRNYCTTYKELLAVVTFARHFKHYLMGRPFLIRTDHSSLRWLVNFKDAEGMIARWIAHLSCYDYTIEHRKGSSHGNADGLSRKEVKTSSRRCKRDTCPQCVVDGKQVVATLHVPSIAVTVAPVMEQHTGNGEAETVEEEAPAQGASGGEPPEGPAVQLSNWMASWDGDELQELQEADPDIKRVMTFVKEGRRPKRTELLAEGEKVRQLCGLWPTLCIKDGRLYRLWIPKNSGLEVYQLVAPLKLQKDVFQEVHAGRTGGHLAVKRTLGNIRQRLFWPHCKKDIERWCHECDICAQVKAGPGFRAPLHQVPYAAPHDRIAIDILGELPETENGNKYILVVSDYFTKWTQAFALPDQTAQTVADVLMTQYISLFGTPCQLHSDQGRNFESELFQELCRLLGVEKIRTTPYRPQSDGMVERFNRTVQQMLKAYVNEDRDNWDDHLPYIMMAYRATIHESTGCSPNLMMFGRELHLPIDVMMGPPPQNSGPPECPVEYVEWVRRTLETAHAWAYKHLKVSASRQKRYYDLRAKPTRYSPGQFVWRWYPPAAKKKLGKGWTGPYKIMKCPTDFHCVIRRYPDSVDIRVHVDQLKPHLGYKPRVWASVPDTPQPPTPGSPGQGLPVTEGVDAEPSQETAGIESGIAEGGEALTEATCPPPPHENDSEASEMTPLPANPPLRRSRRTVKPPNKLTLSVQVW